MIEEFYITTRIIVMVSIFCNLNVKIKHLRNRTSYLDNMDNIGYDFRSQESMFCIHVFRLK
jgi:hypothetical protein